VEERKRVQKPKISINFKESEHEMTNESLARVGQIIALALVRRYERRQQGEQNGRNK
jgi:hypothetical protein